MKTPTVSQTPDLDKVIADLRAKLAKMTPEPWAVEDRRRAPLKNIRIVAGRHDVGEVSDVHQRDYQGSFRGDHKAADAVDAVGLGNATGIVALRNAVPALLTELDRLRAALARSEPTAEERKALERFAEFERKQDEEDMSPAEADYPEIMDDVFDSARLAVRQNPTGQEEGR